MARRDFGGLQRRRMRAVRLVEQGETQAAVARRLDLSRTTAMGWAQAWDQEGREGLRAAGRAGRKPRLWEEQFQQIGQLRAMAGPADMIRSSSDPDFEHTLSLASVEAREPMDLWLPFIPLTLELGKELATVAIGHLAGTTRLHLPMVPDGGFELIGNLPTLHR